MPEHPRDIAAHEAERVVREYSIVVIGWDPRAEPGARMPPAEVLEWVRDYARRQDRARRTRGGVITFAASGLATASLGYLVPWLLAHFLR